MASTLQKSVIHNILPQEIFVKILKKVNFECISLARLTCKQWKRVIDAFKIVKAISGEFYHILEMKSEYQSRY